MPGESRTVHGIHPVLEALRAHPDDVERIYVLEGNVAPRAAAEILSRAREARVKVEKVPRERLQAMVEGGVHQPQRHVPQFDPVHHGRRHVADHGVLARRCSGEDRQPVLRDGVEPGEIGRADVRPGPDREQLARPPRRAQFVIREAVLERVGPEHQWRAVEFHVSSLPLRSASRAPAS